MKSIQRFSRYRGFLEEAYQNARRGQSRLTLEKYSRKLGMGASNFKMILAGTRNLTAYHCLSVARALRMSPFETDYFEALVHYEQAKVAWEKAFYSRRLKRAKKALKTENVRITSKVVFSDPIVPALLVYLSDHVKSDSSLRQLDRGKLAEMFNCSPDKIDSMMDIFVREKLIETDGNGKTHFVFDKLTNVVSQKLYLKRLLTEAGDRLESEFEKSESYFTAFTFSTTDENLQGLRADLKDLMERHMALVDGTTSSARIAQACFQVFPISNQVGVAMQESQSCQLNQSH